MRAATKHSYKKKNLCTDFYLKKKQLKISKVKVGIYKENIGCFYSIRWLLSI